MKKLALIACAALLIACSGFAIAEPPYDITYTFAAPSTGGPVDGYRAYVDDCAVSGPTGAPVGTVVSGQTFSGLITADGTYEFCVRGFNATGEQPDPGVITTVSINQQPLPGPLESLDIVVTCRDGQGAVISCAASGVTVTFQ